MKKNIIKVLPIKMVLFNLSLSLSLVACIPEGGGSGSSAKTNTESANIKKKPQKLKDASVITIQPGQGYYSATNTVVKERCYTVLGVTYSDTGARSEFSSVSTLLSNGYKVNTETKFSEQTPYEKTEEVVKFLKEQEYNSHNLNYAYYGRVVRSVNVDYDIKHLLSDTGATILKTALEENNPEKFFSACGDRLISKYDLYGDITALLQFQFTSQSDKTVFEQILKASITAPTIPLPLADKTTQTETKTSLENSINLAMSSYGRTINIATQARQAGGGTTYAGSQYIPANSFSTCYDAACLMGYFNDLQMLVSYFASDYMSNSTPIKNPFTVSDQEDPAYSMGPSHEFMYDNYNMLQTGSFQLSDLNIADYIKIETPKYPESLSLTRRAIMHRYNEAETYISKLKLLRNSYPGLETSNSQQGTASTSIEKFIDDATAAFEANKKKLNTAPYNSCFDLSSKDNESTCLAEVPKSLDSVNKGTIKKYINPLNQKLTDTYEVMLFQNQLPTQTGYLSFYPRLSNESSAVTKYIPLISMSAIVPSMVVVNVDDNVPQENDALHVGIFGTYYADDSQAKNYKYGTISNCNKGGYYKLYLAKDTAKRSSFSVVCSSGGSTTAIVHYNKIKNSFYMDPVPAFKK